MNNTLLGLIEKHAHDNGIFTTIVPGLRLTRFEKPQSPYHDVLVPTLAIVAQGEKLLVSGVNKFAYDHMHYVVATHELPLTIAVTKASRVRPYLGLQYDLDLSEIPMIGPTPAGDHKATTSAGIFLSPITDDLINAVVRLLQLLDRREEVSVMAPLIHREILFRILQGPHGAQMRTLANTTSRSNRVASVIAWLRKNYTDPFSMKELSAQANMSVSGLHAHFKAITGMTPLEFHKHLRLHEARRQMHSFSMDASSAAYKVGYQSASQFNREFKRLFGQTPGREVRLHE